MLIARFFFGLIFAGLAYSALAIGPVWLMTGSLHWPRGWLAIGVLWGTQLVGGSWFLKNDPALLDERMAPGENSTADKLATLLIVFLLLSWFVGNPIDVHRLQLLPALPASISLIGGFALFAFGMAVIVWTFRENSFATSVVKVQEERQQQVIDSGPYAYVRHPMYAGMIPLCAGLGLLFESSAMALAALPMVMIGFLPRIIIEEGTLRARREDALVQTPRAQTVPLLCG